MILTTLSIVILINMTQLLSDLKLLLQTVTDLLTSEKQVL